MASVRELARGYGLVEGPLWHEGLGLLFSDVLNGGVFCLEDGAAGAAPRLLFPHRRGVGGMAWHERGGVVVSGRNVSLKPYPEGATVLLLDRDQAAGNVGYNDLTTDQAGRIYVGSLGASPVFEDGREPASGDLYLIDLDGSARVVAEDVALTNGLGVSPDGRRLYHSDSRRQQVYGYDVKTNGDLGDRFVFAEFAQGAPDGLAVARDGSVCVALAAGGKGVAVLSPAGEQRELLEIPEPMCTSVCFGGQELETLFVVSGSEGSDSDRAGAVYALDAGLAGLPLAPARVALPAAEPGA
jgi:gluconolactonase